MSTPTQMQPARGDIFGRLTQDLPSTRLQGGIQYKNLSMQTHGLGMTSLPPGHPRHTGRYRARRTPLWFRVEGVRCRVWDLRVVSRRLFPLFRTSSILLHEALQSRHTGSCRARCTPLRKTRRICSYSRRARGCRPNSDAPTTKFLAGDNVEEGVALAIAIMLSIIAHRRRRRHRRARTHTHTR